MKIDYLVVCMVGLKWCVRIRGVRDLFIIPLALVIFNGIFNII